MTWESRLSTASRRIAVAGIALWSLRADGAAKRYVKAPEVSFADLIPYMRARIVPQLSGAEFSLFLCSGAIDRTVVAHYDEALGEFAYILVYETLRERRGVRNAAEKEADSFRSRLPGLTAEDRARYRDIVREELESDPAFMKPIEAAFAKAQSEGKIRCSVCEHDPSFRPPGVLP